MASVPPVSHDRAMAGVPKDSNVTNLVFGNGAVNKLAAKRIVSSAIESDTHSAVTSTIGTATITDAVITDAVVTNLSVTNFTPVYPALTLLTAMIPNTGLVVNGSVMSPGAIDFYLVVPSGSGTYETTDTVANGVTVMYPFPIQSITLVAAGGPKHYLYATLYEDVESVWTQVPGTPVPAAPGNMADVINYTSVTYTLTTPLNAYVPVKINIFGSVTEDWNQNDCIHMQFIANVVPALIVT